MPKAVRQRAASPVVPPGEHEAALTALAQAANALLAVASALTKANVSPVVPPPSPVPSRAALTVPKLVSMFLDSRERQGRSPRYLRQLKTVLGAFSRGRRRTPAELVTIEEIEDWLRDQDWSNRTRQGARADLSTLFTWGIKRGLLSRNPALGVEVGRAEESEIMIHTPDQVRQVLESARLTDPLACRQLAIRYFAGIRSAEASRLREEDIKGELIEVPAKKSKTRSRRLVTVQPCLSAWLALGPPLGPMRTDRIRQAVIASGVPWAHNVTRHSFVSYHLARFEQPGQTAMQAGHSEAILFRHYRALVTPARAAAFWAIFPKGFEQPSLEVL